MILNNLGNANVQDNKLVEFTEQSIMDWQVVSSDGQKVSGTLGASEFTDVTPSGRSPWSVKMGSKDFSRNASVDGIESADATVSCLIVFPIGPNNAHLFVDERK